MSGLLYPVFTRQLQQNQRLSLTVLLNSLSESEISFVVTTKDIGYPLPNCFPSVRMSGTTSEKVSGMFKTTKTKIIYHPTNTIKLKAIQYHPSGSN